LRAFAATQAFATNAPVTLLFVSDFSRMEKGKTDENVGMANMDVGYISQNAYLYCASAGLVTGARASFNRNALTTKLKLRPDQVIALAQSVGYPKP
jgi:nitroreductase